MQELRSEHVVKFVAAARQVRWERRLRMLACMERARLDLSEVLRSQDARVAAGLGECLPALRQCVRWGSQMAAGLAHLHRYNVIHSDFKPKNVVLDEAIKAKIADFGLSGVKQVDKSCLSVRCFSKVGYMLARARRVQSVLLRAVRCPKC